MVNSFRNAFLRALTQSNRSLEQIAATAGVPVELLTSLVQSHEATVSVDAASRIAQSLGTSLDQMLNDPSVSGHIQIAQLYSSLPPLLKAQLEAYAQELADDVDLPHTPKPR